MGVNGVAHWTRVAAVAYPADHIDHLEAHRRGTDIPCPCFVLPADGYARAIV